MTNITISSNEKSSLNLEGNSEDDALVLSLPQESRTIVTRSTDPEIESLYGKYKRGKLILDPDFQRRFVWDRTKASRLIESALLSVPLPIIYLAEEAYGRESVIDGQQRLTSFFSFIDGKLPNGEIFRLTGMKVFTELEKKTYKELDEILQDKIRYHQIRAITILHSSDPNLKFEIFERLNKGAVALNNMELRNCIYQGEYIALLKQLAREPEFMQILGLKEPDARMRDVEMVLRFAAFYHTPHLKYKGPMNPFLNTDMKNHRYITKEDADRLKSAFKNGLQIGKSLFGELAFKRFHSGTRLKPNGFWGNHSANAALYDVIMGIFHDIDKNRVYAALDSLREGLLDLMSTNIEFIDAIMAGTSDEARVKRRYKLALAVVDNILTDYTQQPRCFSSKLKKELFDKDPTCTICNNQIQLIDDAAIDHIHQYWLGGQTIPENARLAHRYCNQARPRNE